MKVRATRLGYYMHERRRPGQVFELAPKKGKNAQGENITIDPEKQFSKSWMEKVDPTTRVRKAPPVSQNPAELTKTVAASPETTAENPDSEEAETQPTAGPGPSEPTGDTNVI